MSQATYRENDVRSTLSYHERETALFGESSFGSDYDTEEALSQPTTDDGSVDPVEEATVPSRQVPRRDRDQSPVTVRYGASLVTGPDGNHTQTQLCLHRGCPYAARVWQNFKFCSRTCGRKVSLIFWLGDLHLTYPLYLIGKSLLLAGQSAFT